MIEATPVEHAVVIVFATVYPAYSAITWPAFVRAAKAGTPGVRMRAYAEILVVQWTLTLLLLWSGWSSGRPWGELGLSMPGLAGGIGLGIAAVLALLMVVQVRGLARGVGDDVAASLRAQLGDTALLLPHTLAEHRTFRAVSMTAGFCEEVVFRGFLPLYLLAWLPSPWTWIVAVCVFGLAHAYQGPRGVLKTGMVGAVMAGATVLTGSLWTAIVLHALIDLQGGAVGYAVLRSQATRDPSPKVTGA